VILDEAEIRQSLARVTAAFPGFREWQHNNEVNEEYSGFALWGEFIPDPTEPMPRRFFLTIDTDGVKWRGHLSIGQHCYLWSSADFGDAYLLDTRACVSLEEAISMLKTEEAKLFAALVGSNRPEPDSIVG
jgi:hypothetical protein